MRSLLAAAAAFVLVVASGLFLWWLRPVGPGTDVVNGTNQTPDAFSSPGVVELAVGDVLWPAGDTAGTPSSVAEMFAREVLGWNQATAAEVDRGVCVATPTGRGESCWASSVAVTLTQPGVASLDLVMLPIGESNGNRLWSVLQAGPGYPTDRLARAPASGSRIPLPPVDDAMTADVTMRIAATDDVVVVAADPEALVSGFVDTNLVPDPGEVLSILVRYFDENEHAITAVGGPWNEFYEWAGPEPAGPEVVIAEGNYQGTDRSWTLSAFLTTDNTLCIRLEGMGCVADIPPGEHLGAVLATTSSGPGEEGRWCVYGPVRDAAAVEIQLADGSSIAPIYIYTNASFNVDFYAYCSLGIQPAHNVAALDTDGNIIDTAPDTP
jgi:hypothetical protein